MATIFDYFDWRGDVKFSGSPFNEVDSLALNEMAYAHIEDYMSPGERLTISEASGRYFAGENNPDFTLGVEALRRMGQLERFKNLQIYNLESYVDPQTQFAAMCIDLPGNYTYIIFRGTDETITGWREDFAISYSETPGQQLAMAYLDRYITGSGKKFIIGGHSKGGNLAVYASMKLNPYKQELINEIWNLDGPGIAPEFFDEKGFEAIRGRIKRYSPAYSVVGKLFEQDVPAIKVASTVKGITQHDAKTWAVMGASLVRTDEVYDDCELTNKVLKEWIDSANMDEREAFTKEFFAALEVHGAETMIEFQKSGMIGAFNVVYKVAKFTPFARKAFTKLLKSAGRNTVGKVPGRIGSTVSWLANKAFDSMIAAAPTEGSIEGFGGAEFNAAQIKE